jgi:hypothetical protein
MQVRKVLATTGATDRQEYLNILTVEIRRSFGTEPKHFASAIVVTPSAQDVSEHSLVEIFEVQNIPLATRVYAWTRTIPSSGESRVITILGIPPIDSPCDAINVYVQQAASAQHGQTTEIQ